MKNKKTRVTSLLLAMLFAVSAASFALAIEPVEILPEPPGGEPLGTQNDPGATLIIIEPQPISQVGLRAINTLMFGIDAANVSELLTSYGVTGKSFQYKDLTNGYLRISGTLTHTGSQKVKAGACFYNMATREFIPVGYANFTSGVFQTTSFERNFYFGGGGSEKFYAFVKNEAGYGTVSGNLFLYNSDT